MTGWRNLITDVEGLLVGNASDDKGLTGTTVVVPDKHMVLAADCRGGAPGTRELDALRPENIVETIHALVLSGGSVFGLDAASAVAVELAKKGIGFKFGDQPWPCPVVPAAVLFDLMNGGNKAWGAEPPYRRLGAEALANAAEDFALGNVGAGCGAMAGALKGGLGSASAQVGEFTVGALVAVNSVGSCADPATGNLFARSLAIGDEMGFVVNTPLPAFAATKIDLMKEAAAAGANTTIAVVATDASLTKAEALRLAIMAQDGLAMAIRPAHTPFDGDTVFAASTMVRALPGNRPLAVAELGAAAATTLARAVGRALWHASSTGKLKCFREVIGA